MESSECELYIVYRSIVTSTTYGGGHWLTIEFECLQSILIQTVRFFFLISSILSYAEKFVERLFLYYTGRWRLMDASVHLKFQNFHI
jgi:hypothetical protein